MKKLKQIIAGLLACAVTLCAAGCGQGETAEQTSGNETTILTGDTAITEITEISDEQTTEAVTEAVTEETSAETTAPAEESDAADSADSAETEDAAVATSEAYNPEDTAETAAAATTTTTAAVTAATAAAKKESITVTVSVSNTWEEGGKVCTQIDGVVKNTTSKNITSWSFDIALGKGAEINQMWNCIAKVSGNSVKVQNEAYNGEIAAGGETTFGGIVKTNAKFTPSVSGTNVTEGSAPASTAAQNNGGTTAKTTEPEPADIEVVSTGKYGLVSECGQLSVKGADLVDKNGDKVQLRGISTHGIQWFPQFANKKVFKTLRDDWNVNVIRLAMYTGNGEGYTDSTKDGIEKTVQDAVDAAISLDMYVIVDWHVLQDQSPMVMKDDALRFFKYMSKKYADYPNVIYEICNEPNGYATWDNDIKPYAEEVIPVIRKNAPNAVVIVGTPTWSQDIDKALANPLEFDNVMYALHFYAATHTDWLRQRVEDCYNKGLPIFVSEYGLCDASGNGSNDFDQAKKWYKLLDKLNISYVAWAMADKAETCCLLKPGASSDGKWSDSDLNESGKWLKDYLSKK